MHVSRGLARRRVAAKGDADLAGRAGAWWRQVREAWAGVADGWARTRKVDDRSAVGFDVYFAFFRDDFAVIVPFASDRVRVLVRRIERRRFELPHSAGAGDFLSLHPDRRLWIRQADFEPGDIADR